MEIELWYLLLVPIVFGAGWFARSFDMKEKKETEHETQTLYKGLDLLLNNQRDQAINSFINLAKIDPDTVELHFTLGAQFRKRGEFEKSVKIHNHLFSRADLPKEVRARALYELGQDFLKAGLWDRAEKTFRQLSEMDSSYQISAIQELVNIYESEKEWQKAIDEAHILERRSNKTFPDRISNLYCELTTQALMKKDANMAQAYLEKAIEADPQNKRAHIIRGQILKTMGNLEEAVNAWKQVGQISPQYETLVVGPIAQAMLDSGKEEDAVRYLSAVAERGNNTDELDIATDWISKIKGPEEAIKLLKIHLKDKPTLIGFRRLVALRLEQEPDNEEMKELSVLLTNQINRTSRYKCSSCGFVMKNYQWQCPGCRNWDSFSPVRTEVQGGR